MKTDNHPALHVTPMCPVDDASSGLVAVILCCEEAAELAATMLPATSAVFGDRWFFLVASETASGKFVDPVSGETIIEVRDANGEFANIGVPVIELSELLRAVARLAAFSLARSYCTDVIDGDEEGLIRSLDDMANAEVVEQILVWLDYPPADAPLLIGG